MNISVFGTGNMASGLAVLFAKAGHAVTVSSRDEAKAQAVAAELGNGISAASFADAAGAAEAVVLAVPYEAAAKVVKAFNTVFASVLQNEGKAGGQPATVFVASDDENARNAVATLARNAGFKSIDAGGLASARYLEPVAGFNIALGYGLGHGTDIAPTWQGIA